MNCCEAICDVYVAPIDFLISNEDRQWLEWGRKPFDTRTWHYTPALPYAKHHEILDGHSARRASVIATRGERAD
jgi:hypothetical protein